MEIVEVKPNPSSAATLTGLVVPPMFKGPDEGITMMFYQAVVCGKTCHTPGTGTGFVDGSSSHHVSNGARWEIAICISVVVISGVIGTCSVMAGSVSMFGV